MLRAIGQGTETGKATPDTEDQGFLGEKYKEFSSCGEGSPERSQPLDGAVPNRAISGSDLARLPLKCLSAPPLLYLSILKKI